MRAAHEEAVIFLIAWFVPLFWPAGFSAGAVVPALGVIAFTLGAHGGRRVRGSPQFGGFLLPETRQPLQVVGQDVPLRLFGHSLRSANYELT